MIHLRCPTTVGVSTRNGADAIAAGLVPVIEKGGGEVRTRTPVVGVLIENDAITGVSLKDGRQLRCPIVISDIGARNTITQLLPSPLQDSAWAREILSFRPSACHIGMYLGFSADIRSLGATSSNHWFYASTDIANGRWHDPANHPCPPALFVSFPSLKHAADGTQDHRHTAELVTFTDWEVFTRWESSQLGRRAPDYLALKAQIADHLRSQFARHFPALAPLIVQAELSTPLSTVAFTAAEHGGAYGLEASPRRFLSTSLHAKTPVPGLYLTGQDVGSAGITGAMMGGMMAAGAIEPRLLARAG